MANYLLKLLPLTLLCSAALARGETLTVETASLDEWDRQEVRHYVLSLLPAGRADGIDDAAGGITLDCDVLGADVCAPIRDALDVDGTANPGRIESLWRSTYHQTSHLRGNAEAIPETLVEFRARHGYDAWTAQRVEQSVVKRADRVLFRGSLPDGRRISGAETRLDDDSVREVEVAVEAKLQPGSYHFYVYGPDGRLVDESEFPAGRRSAPKICTACHMDRSSGAVDRFFP